MHNFGSVSRAADTVDIRFPLGASLITDRSRHQWATRRIPLKVTDQPITFTTKDTKRSANICTEQQLEN